MWDLTTLFTLDRQLLLSINSCDNLMLTGIMSAFTTAWTWVPLYLCLFYMVIKNHETMQQIALVVFGCEALGRTFAPVQRRHDKIHG